MGKVVASNSGIKTPEGLSDAERKALIERARYKAFVEKGANARTVRHSVFAILVIGLMAGAVSVWIKPMLESSLAAQVIFSGATASCWVGLVIFWISRDRVRIINAKIQELLTRESFDQISSSECKE